MPISSSSFIRSTAALLVVGLLALLAIVGTTIWLVERSQTYFNEVIEARVARTAVVALRNSLQQSETSQRGFLLTEDEKYLEPYTVYHDQIMKQFERLREILIPYPQANEPVAQLEQALQTKIAEMDETIMLVRQGRVADAIEIVRTDRGQELMEETNLFFEALINAADERLITGVADQRASITALRWVALAGAVVIILVVGGSAWTVMVYTRELAAARQEVQQLNTGLEERVRARTEDLGRANEEIQRYAYIVTHDLRAPLVNIMGFTSELEASLTALQTFVAQAKPANENDRIYEEARVVAEEDLPEAINFIRSSTRKMDGLINAILKISREGRRQLRPEQLDLGELLQVSANSVHHQITENGGVLDLDSRSSTIVSDRMALEQVFGNLFDNAVKYKQAGRALAVKVRTRDASGNRVFIEVEDNGRGIANQDHERVFELFRRSGAQDQTGEGIGLAHVRTVIRNLGGDITLKSELGVGTTFKISLPRDLRAIVGSSVS
jgi:signal transduction histidine kinase